MVATLRNWFNKHTFRIHVMAFMLMIIPPALLYYAAQRGEAGLIWPLLGLVILGNLMVLLVR